MTYYQSQLSSVDQRVLRAMLRDVQNHWSTDFGHMLQATLNKMKDPLVKETFVHEAFRQLNTFLIDSISAGYAEDRAGTGLLPGVLSSLSKEHKELWVNKYWIDLWKSMLNQGHWSKQKAITTWGDIWWQNRPDEATLKKQILGANLDTINLVISTGFNPIRKLSYATEEKHMERVLTPSELALCDFFKVISDCKVELSQVRMKHLEKTKDKVKNMPSVWGLENDLNTYKTFEIVFWKDIQNITPNPWLVKMARVLSEDKPWFYAQIFVHACSLGVSQDLWEAGFKYQMIESDLGFLKEELSKKNDLLSQRSRDKMEHIILSIQGETAPQKKRKVL